MMAIIICCEKSVEEREREKEMVTEETTTHREENINTLYVLLVLYSNLKRLPFLSLSQSVFIFSIFHSSIQRPKKEKKNKYSEEELKKRRRKNWIRIVFSSVYKCVHLNTNCVPLSQPINVVFEKTRKKIRERIMLLLH